MPFSSRPYYTLPILQNQHLNAPRTIQGILASKRAKRRQLWRLIGGGNYLKRSVKHVATAPKHPNSGSANWSGSPNNWPPPWLLARVKKEWQSKSKAKTKLTKRLLFSLFPARLRSKLLVPFRFQRVPCFIRAVCQRPDHRRKAFFKGNPFFLACFFYTSYKDSRFCQAVAWVKTNNFLSLSELFDLKADPTSATIL